MQWNQAASISHSDAASFRSWALVH